MRKLFAAKLAMGGVLALLAIATLGGLLYLGLLQANEPVRALDVPVQVMGPEGDRVYGGIVSTTNATAYSALRAAARDGNFTVGTVDYGDRVFVEEIAGYRNEGASGWTYAVTVGEDGAWCYPNVAADRYAMKLNQQLLWRWSSEPVDLAEC